jgi:HlyD family secretion protein
VRQIRNAPQTLQNVVTYDAVIDVDNSDLKLRPGMTANVTFISAEKDNVLRAPNAAMRFRPATEIFTTLGVPVPKEAQAQPRADRSGGGNPGGGGTGGPREGGGARPAGGGGGGFKARAAGRGEVSDRRTVWVLRNGQPQAAPLRVGLSDGSMTEIVEGDVHEGDLLIVDASIQGQAATATTNQPPGGMRRLF